ncbi:MAG: hypothetical protein JXQ84_07810 [Rhodospirillaceae bacterium]|nr:hypothetical protein [Rhodospirillaceae bacterium]
MPDLGDMAQDTEAFFLRLALDKARGRRTEPPTDTVPDQPDDEGAASDGLA